MTEALQLEVVELLNHVPREPGTVLPSGATEEALADFERLTGVRLPAELRVWLRTCNAPCVGPGGLYGVAPAPAALSIQEHLEFEAEWRIRGWLPVAGDGCGNYYLLDGRLGAHGGHPVLFLDHERGLTESDYVVASSLWHFLRALLRNELEGATSRSGRWPFDAAVTLAADPALLHCSDVAPLPWETI